MPYNRLNEDIMVINGESDSPMSLVGFVVDIGILSGATTALANGLRKAQWNGSSSGRLTKRCSGLASLAAERWG
jgi:hypothetical protein